ncbi:hypothetical protein M422DRAFT_260610 [Sphaerobolus stellatus SS14]|uniref:Uncharacterized protein n=1 Tax=Sphaerobolus stellatus (strain SS14) TaxID=990650 RepID=A0A0C9UQK1_SPHS4|nr:hypothetical protein M422DRAFT_260610 [Sphaerobolus stellatus SS14]
MSTHCSPNQAEELSALASSKVFAQEHPGDQNVRVHSPQTVPIRVQSPIGMAGAASTSAPSQCLSRGIISGSDSGHNLGGAPDKSDHASPDEGGTENEDGSFAIKASEVGRLCEEYADLMNLKENGEIVLMEAMKATKQLNTMLNQIRTSINRMSPTMKELFIVPKNNWTRDKAATKAATKQIVAQGTPDVTTSGTHPEECTRLYQSRKRNNLSVAQVIQGIPESIECSQHSMGETQSIDMNALREGIKEMISATIKEKLCSDADSVTTVSQSTIALDANAQYWSDLSNKVAHHSCRALELQLKMAEEKVNILLHKEAPEEALLEAAQEAHTICFQLDQNTHLHEAGLMPEQQVRFRIDTGM